MLAFPFHAAEKIRSKIIGSQWGHIELATKPDKASVYLDGHYMGKTPLLIKYMPLSEFSLNIKKKGYKQVHEEIKIEKEKSLFIQRELEKQEFLGKVEVISNPPGAFVYLDTEYKGKTPLLIDNIEPGTHRLKLTKNNYAPLVETIKIKLPHEKIKLRKTLKEPSESKEYILLDFLSNKNLTYGFLGISAFFSAGGLYYLSKKDQENEKLSRDLSSHNPALYTAQDQEIIDSMQTKINNYDKLSKNSFIISASLFFTSGYFFLRYLFSGDSSEQYSHKTNDHHYHVKYDINIFSTADMSFHINYNF